MDRLKVVTSRAGQRPSLPPYRSVVRPKFSSRWQAGGDYQRLTKSAVQTQAYA
jgi:hypothetical protein